MTTTDQKETKGAEAFALARETLRLQTDAKNIKNVLRKIEHLEALGADLTVSVSYSEWSGTFVNVSSSLRGPSWHGGGVLIGYGIRLPKTASAQEGWMRTSKTSVRFYGQLSYAGHKWKKASESTVWSHARHLDELNKKEAQS